MERLDTSKPRSGNLMLCECGHLKAFHRPFPMWHGGPLAEGAPCSCCQPAPGQPSACQAFQAAPFQGYRMVLDPHAAMWAK